MKIISDEVFARQRQLARADFSRQLEEAAKEEAAKAKTEEPTEKTQIPCCVPPPGSAAYIRELQKQIPQGKG